jgi:RNA polymerase sigma-70 factor, ECF subfamily
MSSPSDTHAHRAAEEVAQTSYGRLVSMLAVSTGSIAQAEDVLADAFAAALRTWPERGVPDSPVAWILTVARRNFIGNVRTAAARALAEQALRTLARAEATAMAGPAIGDDRLRLMFVCTHPAIDVTIHAPLMLQVVLGIDAIRMASVFHVNPTTLGQRLVRAKRKIAASGISFEVPDRTQLPERLHSVLDAVYAAFTTGWDDPGGLDEARADLADEAIRLARLVVELLPDQPESLGLLALMLHARARTAARRDPSGRFVPLDQQDTTLWSRALMSEAEQHLSRAAAMGSLGPYQLEAAIQSVHGLRAVTGRTDWQSIATLYDGLEALVPSLGVRVARSAAHARVHGAAAGLALLDGLSSAEADRYQPYWVVRLHLLLEVGDRRGAEVAREHALGLTEEPALRAHLASLQIAPAAELPVPGAPDKPTRS